MDVAVGAGSSGGDHYGEGIYKMDLTLLVVEQMDHGVDMDDDDDHVQMQHCSFSCEDLEEKK